ncbi:MAG TPA: hypothetical protein VHT96_08495 [Clostridia bacterium]|nr:hypothetical protein [Clostridia bacterium]
MEHSENYIIKVEGHISKKRIGCFENVEVKLLEDGSTLIELSGYDQARLHAVLSRIRDLGLILVLVLKSNGKKGVANSECN